MAKDILKAEDIKGTNVSTILPRMFRKMLVYVAGTVDVDDKTINTLPVDDGRFTSMVASGRYDQLMKNFVNDARNCIGRNRKDQSSARGNLQKELLKADMSWKVFTKGLRFLGVTSFEITVVLSHKNGTRSAHTEKVNLGKSIMLPEIPNEQPPQKFTTRNIDESTRIVEQATQIVERFDKNT